MVNLYGTDQADPRLLKMGAVNRNFCVKVGSFDKKKFFKRILMENL